MLQRFWRPPLRERLWMLHQWLNVGQVQIRPRNLNSSWILECFEATICKILSLRVGFAWPPIKVAAQSNLFTCPEIFHEDEQHRELGAETLTGDRTGRLCSLHTWQYEKLPGVESSCQCQIPLEQQRIPAIQPMYSPKKILDQVP